MARGQSDVEYSSILSLPAMVVLGSLASTGLGVFFFIGDITSSMGRQTPLAYGLAVILFLPIILVLGERAAVLKGRGGLFNLSKGGIGAGLHYWAGALLFGAYLLLAVVFSWVIASTATTLLKLLFDLSLDQRLVAIVVIVLVALIRLTGYRNSWRTKTIIPSIAFVFIMATILRLAFFPIKSLVFETYLPNVDAINAVPFLAITLFGATFVLDHRDDLRQPQRRLLAGLTLPLLLSGVIGIITSITLLNYVGLVFTNPTQPLIGLASELSEIAPIMLLLAYLLIALAGLNQTINSEGYLGREMVSAGFLPQNILTEEKKYRRVILLSFSLIMIFLVLLLDIQYLVGGATTLLLLAITITAIHDISNRQNRLPATKRFKLPYHPLFPVTAAVISVSMALAQPPRNHLVTLIWIVIATLYFATYARRGAVDARQRRSIVREIEFELEHTSQAILVPLLGDHLDRSLIQVGTTLARQRQHPLLLLKVWVTEESGPAVVDQQPEVQQALAEMERLLDSVDLTGFQVTPIVRIAATGVDAILSTIWDEQIATLLLGWPASSNESPGLSAEDVDYLVTRAPCEVAVLKDELPDRIQSIAIPMFSISHNPAALALGRDLAQASNAKVQAQGIVHGHPNEEALTKARAYVQESVQSLADPGNIEADVMQLVRTPEDLTAATDSYDLVIIGASDEGIIRPTTFLGAPANTLDSLPNPGLVVKKRERPIDFYLRQGWEWLFHILPKLNRKDRSLVYRGLQTSARANIDYYVLIILAAGIAFLGLQLNSSSVIIGAMLIAPLMNPILAMAHALVVGNLRMMRQSASSTLNGVLMAVVMSAFLSLSLFALGATLDPTTEILSRTSPNLLDLLVALLSGAAAAYALSRSQLAGALPGVAIAAALVPPLCVVGYGLGTGQVDIAAGSALLFATNLAAITAAAAGVFIFLGFRPPIRFERGEQARHGLRLSLIVLVIVSLVLITFTYFSSQQANDRNSIDSILKSSLEPNQGAIENIHISRQRREYIVHFTVLDYTGNFGDAEVYELAQTVSTAVHDEVILYASIVDSRLSISNGSVAPEPAITPLPTAPAASEDRSTPTRASEVTATAEQEVSPSATLTVTLTVTPLPTFTPTELPPLATAPPVDTSQPSPTPADTATAEVTETPDPEVTATLFPTETIEPSATPVPVDTPTLVVTPGSTPSGG